MGNGCGSLAVEPHSSDEAGFVFGQGVVFHGLRQDEVRMSGCPGSVPDERALVVRGACSVDPVFLAASLQPVAVGHEPQGRVAHRLVRGQGVQCLEKSFDDLGVEVGDVTAEVAGDAAGDLLQTWHHQPECRGGPGVTLFLRASHDLAPDGVLHLVAGLALQERDPEFVQGDRPVGEAEPDDASVE